MSVWRALHDAPALKGVWRAVVGLCVLVSTATVLATIVLGAGALGPLSQGMQAAPPDDGAVRFEMQP